MIRALIVPVCVGVSALLASAMPAGAQTPPDPSRPAVTVFAAASLKTALDEVAAAFTARTGIAVRLSFAGSPALARQIENGAPAHLFASADTEWMDHLQKEGLILPDTRVDLLGNRLVLIAPATSPVAAMELTPAAFAAVLGPDGRLALGEIASVPAGRYAKASLEALGLWAGLADRLAQTENVRVALTFVARGEAPLGIVYATDALSEPRVRVVASLPTATHPPIIYPFALTRAAGASQEARQWREFLTGAQARALFERHGFVVRAPP